MICPKCYSKTKVLDTRHDIKENETYRQHLCTNTNCNYKFYTVEFEVIKNKSFKEKYSSITR